jgi:hypothetical protein
MGLWDTFASFAPKSQRTQVAQVTPVVRIGCEGRCDYCERQQFNRRCGSIRLDRFGERTLKGIWNDISALEKLMTDELNTVKIDYRLDKSEINTYNCTYENNR